SAGLGHPAEVRLVPRCPRALAAELREKRPSGLFVSAVNDDPCALTGAGERDRPADSTCGARHDDSASGETTSGGAHRGLSGGRGFGFGFRGGRQSPPVFTGFGWRGPPVLRAPITEPGRRCVRRTPRRCS